MTEKSVLFHTTCSIALPFYIKLNLAVYDKINTDIFKYIKCVKS